MNQPEENLSVEPNDPSASSVEKKAPKKKSSWLWSLLFVAIAGLSIWAVTSQSKSFSFSQFWDYICNASPFWMIVSFFFMLGFIVFEGLALLDICRSFGYRKKLKNGFLYSASDLYFSAITPSASGGQPASAYFMIKNGIPVATVTVALIANLCMYALSILAIGLVCVIFRPSVFLHFNTFSRVLILVGSVAQIGLVLLFFLLLKKDRWVYNICNKCLRLFEKLHLLRHPDRAREKLARSMEDYKKASLMLSGHRNMMIRVFFFNLLQRASQIAVTPAVFLAQGGNLSDFFDVFSLQGYVVLGSNCVPIPGAMGVSDYLMLDAFSYTMEEEAAVRLELLSRSVSFYSCILICGLTVLISYLLSKKREAE